MNYVKTQVLSVPYFRDLIFFFFFLQILLSKELDKGKTAKDLTGIKYVPPSRP